MPTYLPTYILIYLPTYLPTCLATYLPTHLPHDGEHLPVDGEGADQVEERVQGGDGHDGPLPAYGVRQLTYVRHGACTQATHRRLPTDTTHRQSHTDTTHRQHTGGYPQTPHTDTIH